MATNNFALTLRYMTDAELNTLHEQLHWRLNSLQQQTSQEYTVVSEQLVTILNEKEHRQQQPSDEPLATLYVRSQGKVYRLKAFRRQLWIEQQPNGRNQPFDRYTVDNLDARLAYEDDASVWDIDALACLIEQYERHDSRESDRT